jgi:hypothetical protein
MPLTTPGLPMREHQIVITLKPDQFLEVQRLARAANAKSMGIFVRQKLLAALGIEGTIQGAASTGGGSSDAQQEEILNQIRRLHGELKMFVAESLSIYPGETQRPDEQQTTQTIAPASDNSIYSDELELEAERTFAISPRLGAISSAATADRQQPPAPAASAGDAAGQTPEPTNDLLLSRHELHHRDQHRYRQVQFGDDLLDRPFRPVSPAQPAPVIEDPLDKLLPKSEELPLPADELDEDEFDDTFEFTEDAPFAEQQSQLDEPESDDTGEADVEEHSEDDQSGSDSEADDGEFPLSLAERRRRLALEQQPPLVQAEPAAETAGTAIPPVTPPSTAPADPAGSTQPARPLGHPSLSGSPPPKRRQV